MFLDILLIAGIYYRRIEAFSNFTGRSAVMIWVRI